MALRDCPLCKKMRLARLDNHLRQVHHIFNSSYRKRLLAHAKLKAAQKERVTRLLRQLVHALDEYRIA